MIVGLIQILHSLRKDISMSKNYINSVEKCFLGDRYIRLDC